MPADPLTTDSPPQPPPQREDSQAPDPRGEYTRLPGRGQPLSAYLFGGDRQALYLGPGHLLVMRRERYAESVKRFDLSDIQAITVQSTNAGTVLSVLIGFTLAAFGLVLAAVLASDSVDVRILAGLPLGATVLLLAGSLVWNLMRGPTCETRLHTAVQVQPLTALTRLNSAKQCLSILVPQIEAAQGITIRAGADENDAETSAHAETVWTLVSSPQPAPVKASSNVKRFDAKLETKAIGPGMPATAFGLMMLFGISTVSDIFYRNTLKDFLDFLLLFAMIVLLMVTVVRQFNSTLPGNVRATTWFSLVFNAIAFVTIFYIIMMIDAFSTMDEPVNLVSAPQIVERPDWLYYVTAIMGAINFMLAAYGFAALRGYRVVEKAPAPETEGDA